MKYADGSSLRNYLKENFAILILQGLRERTIPDTPEDYVIIYIRCWDNEPDNRSSMSQ
ncbi:11516_t:CDS:2, partial [Funneliformis geosporum]